MSNDDFEIERCWKNDKGEFVCRAFVDDGEAHVEAHVAPMLDEETGRRSVEPLDVKSLDGSRPSKDGVDALYSWMLDHSEV